ncbi:MAG: putative membrane protein [Kiritimatiellia bacterium]|jgi:uncharacterized membrane protein
MQKLLLRSIGILLGVTYPFLVYFGIQRFNASAFAIILLLALAIRGYSTMAIFNFWQTASLIVLVTYSLVTAILNSQPMLLFYPVVASTSIACIFFVSLKDKQPLLEKFAERMGETINKHAQHYLYWLTFTWGVLLVINAVIAAYTAFYLTLKQWALYNGFISYLLFGSFFITELIFRHFYKKYKIKQDALNE